LALGNQKGGVGKSTTAIHLVIGLIRHGFSVGSIDLDERQGTLSRFMRNRQRFLAASELDLPLPDNQGLYRSIHDTSTKAGEDEISRLAKVLERFRSKDFIVIDIAGDNTFLSRCGHILADTLITPMNDSFMDLDALVRIDVDGERIIGPSAYSVMVTDGSARRAAFGGGTPDWIVMRNRLSQLDSRNKRQMQALLDTLAPRIGFRIAPGFSERVIFRQLFTSGLTVLDLDNPAIGISKSKSHRTAVQEIEDLLTLIGLPEQKSEDTADRQIA
jgi:chromosome partitioning protein